MATILKRKKEIILVSMFLLIAVFFLLGNVKNSQIKNQIIMGGIFLLVIIAGLAILIRKKSINTEYIAQLLPFSFIAALFWNLSVLSQYTEKKHMLFLIFGEFVFNFFFFELSVICFEKKDIKRICFHLNKYFYLFTIMFLYLICVSFSMEGWLGLDGVIYYQSLREIRSWNFIDLFSLQMCGHVSQGYSIFALIGEYLFPNQVIGVRIINIFLALAAIFAFYKIVEKICGNASSIVKASYASIFAFSPMVLGMVHEINLDFPMLCFFTCMVASYLYNKEIWMIAFSILLCFSKEPGVILYGMFIIGILIGRFLEQLKKRQKITVSSIFTRDIVLSFYGGILWISLYLGSANHGWTENAKTSTQINGGVTEGTLLNTFSFDMDYIIVRLKEMFFVNCTWVVVLAALLGMLFIENAKKNVRIGSIYAVQTGVFSSFIGFVGYNCFYVTWIHYRYLMVLAFFISFLYLSVHAQIQEFRRSRLAVNFILAGLLLCSNFLTVDPLSIWNFNHYYTGKTALIIPCVMGRDENGIINIYNMPGGDINNAAFYNLEWDYFGMGFNHMLDELKYDESKLILIHENKNKINCFFGIYSKLTDALYWNSKQKQLNINTYDIVHDSEEYQYFNVGLVETLDEIKNMDLSNYKEVYLIDFPINEKIYEDSSDECEFLKKFEYGMWSWDIYEIHKGQ